MQKRNEQTFGDIPGVHVDAMIITADDEKQHDEILQKVMQCARQRNIKFNKDKIQYKINELRYLGNLVTSTGVKPDRGKVEAIVKISEPNDRKALTNK